ncbi:adenine deaminase [Deinococcus psychrotolerans]|uniref:Adenine deaminase n=1 Tax=Deinococcus psychrotolerans TaxID=2489213 RepID=A0A3G8YBR0_9DEIO|nr:adenine deaminase C-terminal domain-containing protein [Deinococcus psychrotolerans]AZI42370.1 adenine deaminase [Deinococcus psychrotolerans]
MPDPSLSPSPETTLRQRLVRVALRQEPADLVIRNAQIVSVTTRELLSGDVAIAGGYVAAIGPDYQAPELVDAGGKYLAPGLIDGHIHIESSMLTPASFARAVRPRGTTGVVAEPHEIVNVLGEVGLRWILEAGEKSGLRVWGSQPSCVPASSFEEGGTQLGAADIARGLAVPGVLGLAEMMNYPGVLSAAPEVWATLQAARGGRIDGHAAGLSGDALQAYAAAGIHSDHEATTEAEARERVRAGLWLMVREGSAARNLEALIPVLRSQPRRALLVSDDISADWLLEKGHLDNQLRRLVASGIDPLYALSLATCNAAEYWNLMDVGVVAAGFRADLVLFEDLQDFKVAECWLGGQPLASLDAPVTTPALLGGGVDAAGLAEADLSVPAHWPVIGVRPDQIETYIAPVGSGDTKLVVADRYGRGLVSAALTSGIGLQRGAVALSVLHDAHHLVIAGALGPGGDADIRAAGLEVQRLGGGVVVVDGGQVVVSLPLPYGGLMSDWPPAEVAARVRAIQLALHQRGCPLPEALTTLSFLGLSVIPDLKLTPRGLLDVRAWKLV